MTPAPNPEGPGAGDQLRPRSRAGALVGTLRDCTTLPHMRRRLGQRGCRTGAASWEEVGNVAERLACCARLYMCFIVVGMMFCLELVSTIWARAGVFTIVHELLCDTFLGVTGHGQS